MDEFSWDSEANPWEHFCVSVEVMRPVKKHGAIMVTLVMVSILLSCALINGVMDLIL